jgi:hypothetical protein
MIALEQRRRRSLLLLPPLPPPQPPTAGWLGDDSDDLDVDAGVDLGVDVDVDADGLTFCASPLGFVTFLFSPDRLLASLRTKRRSSDVLSSRSVVVVVVVVVVFDSTQTRCWPPVGLCGSRFSLSPIAKGDSESPLAGCRLIALD